MNGIEFFSKADDDDIRGIISLWRINERLLKESKKLPYSYTHTRMVLNEVVSHLGGELFNYSHDYLSAKISC